MALYVDSGYVEVGYTIDDITIDWGTKVIYVPKEYTTLVQSTPIEIRQLSINDFRLKLKELEWSLEGMAHERTHNHNTEVLLGGVVYARVVEMINGYTITFEDGAYAVNLIGANSNIGDVINLNRVSVRSSNAAGLISNQAIEYSSFNGAVTIDAINGTTGTVFPKGTPQQPVNNVPDAIRIAELRGFKTINVIGDYTFGDGDFLSGYQLYGQSAEQSSLTFLSGSSVARINIFDSTITGIFDGVANFTDCHLIEAHFIKGTLLRCLIEGEITLDGSGDTTLVNCFDGLTVSGLTPTINFGGAGSSLGIRNYSGDIKLTNKTGAEDVELNIATGGKVIIDETVTNGLIRITGIADVEDNTISGATVDLSRVIFPDQLQLSSFNSAIHLNPNEGLSGTKYPLGTIQNPVNNIDDAITIANNRGLRTILLGGSLFLTDTDISDFIFFGENNLNSSITLVSGNTTNKTIFRDMLVSGELNGYILTEKCAVGSLSNVGSTIFPTIFRDTLIRADDGLIPAILLKSGTTQNIHFLDCTSGVPGQGTATIDFNNSLSPIAFRRYGGGIRLKNITGNQDSTFEFNQGQIKIDSSCTNGTIRIGGIYKLINNGTLTLEERNQSITDSINFSGASFSADTTAIAAAVWDKLTADHQTADTFGKMLYEILVATGQIQHTGNVNTELLQNKPNNP